MPWYKAGTVSVVQNSTTVTGTNTAFAANSRVGDAFLGPDGNWYEVANIASDTVISILPAYQGANASGTYALAPMQGYVKDSADQLRILVNKFGTLAAAASINALAGVSGSAGSIPYFTAADAMSLLKVTSSATDNTAGRLMKVGDFGGPGSQVSPASTQANVKDLGTVGAYRLDTGNTGTPYGAARNGDIIQVSAVWNGGVVHQTYYGVEGLIWHQLVSMSGSTGTVTRPWAVVFDSRNIVGTVGQANGIPTGAVIERGSNANGEYVRFADGTQICTVQLSINSTGTYAVGNVFGSDAYAANWPANFVAGTLRVSAGLAPSQAGNNKWPLCWVAWNLSSAGSWRGLATDNTATGGTLTITGIGRWF
ncbi:hypothetical protein [Pseudomonas sp. NPDC088444]|uniref:hypothetical protein n=1 Tax=Pseudomonas sp. NPDC088444 TaxID=3364456 RepID=UPI00384C6F08